MRKLTLIAVPVICLVVCATLFAARRVCDYCKQPIKKGTWVENGGKNYHSEHFLCDYCSEPIGSKRFYEHEGGKTAPASSIMLSSGAAIAQNRFSPVTFKTTPPLTIPPAFTIMLSIGA
jgi:hypothetical protein